MTEVPNSLQPNTEVAAKESSNRPIGRASGELIESVKEEFPPSATTYSYNGKEALIDVSTLNVNVKGTPTEVTRFEIQPQPAPFVTGETDENGLPIIANEENYAVSVDLEQIPGGTGVRVVIGGPSGPTSEFNVVDLKVGAEDVKIERDLNNVTVQIRDENGEWKTPEELLDAEPGKLYPELAPDIRERFPLF